MTGNPMIAPLKCLSMALVAAALFARPVQAETFQIPSGSMKPTLVPGDVVNAVKYPAGSAPQRGDLIAFRVPSEPRTTHIFRVVGLAGERIQVVNGILQINGEPVKREQIADFADNEDGKAIKVKRWRETLPNNVSHETLDLEDDGFLDNTKVYTVPAGHLFVLGDNRDNAKDSRIGSTGFIPFGNVVARIELPAKKN